MMRFYRYTFHIMDEEWKDIKIHENVYYAVRETPKGYWISISPFKNKWIPKESKKRFAYPTREEAMINFIKRTQRHRAILHGRYKVAGRALSAAEILLNKIKTENK